MGWEKESNDKSYNETQHTTRNCSTKYNFQYLFIATNIYIIVFQKYNELQYKAAEQKNTQNKYRGQQPLRVSHNPTVSFGTLPLRLSPADCFSRRWCH